MRLVDLSPRWISTLDYGDGTRSAITCLTFQCPHCSTMRIPVHFKPYIDPDNDALKRAWAQPDAPNPNTGEPARTLFWQRSGDSFETITLSPSIQAEGHWHGHIADGILITS